MTPPTYLMQMPKRVLFGKCAAIEKWCKENNKERPSLLHLGLARQARK